MCPVCGLLRAAARKPDSNRRMGISENIIIETIRKSKEDEHAYFLAIGEFQTCKTCNHKDRYSKSNTRYSM